MTSDRVRAPGIDHLRTWLVVGALGIALGAVIVLAPRPGGDAAPTTTTTTTTTEPAGPAIDVEPTDAALAQAEIKSGVATLLGSPTLGIDIVSDLDGTIETFEIDLDSGARRYRSIETIGNEDGPAATIERIETPDMIFIRVLDDIAPDPPNWNLIPVEVDDQLQFDRTYTAFGRITPSLPDLVRMIDDLDILASEIRSGDEAGFRVTLRADDVSRYLRDNLLAPMTPSDEIGATTFDFWLDDERLTRLVATGVQFFTGEPFRDARIDVVYTPRPVTIDVPAPMGPDVP